MSLKNTKFPDTSPSHLRDIFGANLKYLCRDIHSISQLCREMGINRTQFNRYLSGDSFPRPDILHRLCVHFGVDARILLEPITQLGRRNIAILERMELRDFIGARIVQFDEEKFPSGFYRIIRRYLSADDQFIVSLAYVYRKDGITFIRGYEPRFSMRQQGLATNSYQREFRGIVAPQDTGIAIFMSRRGALTTSFSFIESAPAFNNNFWTGFSVRSWARQKERSRTSPVIFEFLNANKSAIWETARQNEIQELHTLLPYHIELLKSQM